MTMFSSLYLEFGEVNLIEYCYNDAKEDYDKTYLVSIQLWPFVGQGIRPLPFSRS